MKIRILQLNKVQELYWILISIIVFCSILYIYSINQTVFNGVKQQELSKKLSEAQSNIASLEARYISIKNSITIEKAMSLGFQSASPEFISKKSLGKGLASNNEI